MSVIQASSAGVKDMADGSLRITFEFEPRHAAEAFALFGPRGRAVAIAALKDGAGAVKDEKPSQAAENWRELGPLCKESVNLCANPAFHAFIREDGASDPAGYIHDWCEVGSRKELDTNPGAAQSFALLRKQFQEYVRKTSKVAA